MIVNSIHYNKNEEIIKIIAHEHVENYEPIKHG